MQKIQVMLDNDLAKSIKESAKEAGLSISLYARLLLSKAHKENLTPIEKSLLEPSEKITLDDFKNEIKAMMKNA